MGEYIFNIFLILIFKREGLIDERGLGENNKEWLGFKNKSSIGVGEIDKSPLENLD